MRLITIGSVPPVWGATTMGGVATVHMLHNLQFSSAAALGIDLVGMIATNRPASAKCSPPTSIPVLQPPDQAREQRRWYEQLLRDLRPDMVLIHHITHRWAKWHSETEYPFVGLVHSWNTITQVDRETATTAQSVIARVSSKSSALSFPSQACMEEGVALGIPYPEHVNVLPSPLHPVFTEQGLLTNDVQRPQAPRIAAIGSAIPLKRFDRVLHAAGELGLEVVIIGQGPETERLKHLATESGLGERAVFAGQLEPAAIAQELQRCALLCGPSTSESFGTVYIEALACGIPIVGYEPTLLEIESEIGVPIGKGIKGDASQEEITDAIRQVLRIKWDRASLSRRAAACYSALSIATRLERALRAAAH